MNVDLPGRDMQPFHIRWQKRLPPEGITNTQCTTFEDLLLKRLDEIRSAMEPEIRQLEEGIDSIARIEKLKQIWAEFGADTFAHLFNELQIYGLDHYEGVVDLRGANCVGKHFQGANLSGALFQGARCNRARFDGADCSQTDFSLAGLYDTHFDGADCTSACFNNAHCSKTHFDLSDCLEASFSGAFCDNASFADAHCYGTIFERAICTHAHFEKSNLEYAILNFASLQYAVFDGANCTYARFEGSNLYRTSFCKSDCSSAMFRDARAEKASFEGAFLKSSDIRDMKVFADTVFGQPGEDLRAHFTRFYDFNWTDAADANLRIKQCWRADGYYQMADEYQFREMSCRRKAKSGLRRSLDSVFYYFVAGYGLRISYPLRIIGAVIIVFGLFFACLFNNVKADTDNVKKAFNQSGSSSAEEEVAGFTIKSNDPDVSSKSTNETNSTVRALGLGLYYSIISFTTLGLGEVHLSHGFLINFLICLEALIGATMMPLFVVAYARRILQG